MEQTTVVQDILAIQASDITADEATETLDTERIFRGAAASMNCSYIEIAKEIGMGENKYPESNVKDLCKRALSKMIQHYIFMLISDAAIKNGFSEDDAIDFAAQSYRHEKQIGKTDAQILRGWM